MEFTSIQNEETCSEKNLICPITHKIFQDPVLAGDGHVYERTAIVQWIEGNGTSPITLEPLHIDDLLPEENIKRLCQRQQMPVTYSTGTEEITLLPMRVPQISSAIEQPPIVVIPQQSIHDNTPKKYMWYICTFIVFVILIVIISIFLIADSSSSDSFNNDITTFPFHTTTTGTRATISTTYILRNSCTLNNITTLLSLNNTAPFNYTFHSISYAAVANQTMITFAFQQHREYWAIDDISVTDEALGIEILQNGDFENGTFAPFTYCNQQGFNVMYSNYTLGNQSNSGSYAFIDFTGHAPYYISQTLNTTIGQAYNVTFWLQNGGGSPNRFMVMMST